MGWFNSIIDGVSNAAGWVIDNASTIGTVVSTVAKVASLVVLAEDEDESNLGILTADEPFDMPKFINTMSTAEKVLTAAAVATSKAKIKESALARSNDGSTTYSNKVFTGLWSKPIPHKTLDVPGQDMTADLSHMLAMIQFPQILKIGNTDEDVAKNLGMSIFQPDSPSATELEKKPYDVLTATLTAKDGTEIVCSHAFYAIPSGGEGNELSWHSALSLSSVQTSNSRKAYQAARLESARVPPAIKLDQIEAVDIGNIWQITLNVLWTAATYAAKAAPLLKEYIMKSGAILEIRYTQTDGLTTFIQIRAGPGVTPFQAREVVLSAANSAVIDVETQNPTRALSKMDNAFKPIYSGITQVDIVANKLMPYDAPASPDNDAAQKPVGNGYGNGTADVVKKTPAQRRLVSFQALPEEFGDGYDSVEFEHDGAQFYVPVFPISSRMKSVQV